MKTSEAAGLALGAALGVAALYYIFKKPQLPSKKYPPTTYIPVIPPGAPPGTPGTVGNTGYTPEQLALGPFYTEFVSPLGQIGDVSRQAADVFQTTLQDIPLVGNPLADEFNAFYGAGYAVGNAAFQAGKSAGEVFGSWLKAIGI